MSVCGYVHMSLGAHQSQKRAGVSSLGSGDPGGSEPPDIGVPEQT